MWTDRSNVTLRLVVLFSLWHCIIFSALKEPPSGRLLDFSSNVWRLPSSWSDIASSLPSFWTTWSTDNKEMCALTLPVENPLANWKKTGCNMRNRWICEMRTLIKWSAALFKWRRIYPSVLLLWLFKLIYPVGLLLLLLFSFLELKMSADLFIAVTTNAPKFRNIVMWDILLL